MGLIEGDKDKLHWNLFKKKVNDNYLDEFYVNENLEGFNAVVKHSNKKFFSPAMEVRMKTLLNEIKKINPKDILDDGCGGARTTKMLARSGFRVVGMDLDSRLHEVPREGLSFELVQGSAKNLPFRDNSFDLVICCEVLEHILDREKAIREISRVTKNEGKVIITVPNLAAFDSIEGKVKIISSTIKTINSIRKLFGKKPILEYGHGTHVHKNFPGEWKKVIERNNLKVISSKPDFISLWVPRIVTPLKKLQDFIYKKPKIVNLQLRLDKSLGKFFPFSRMGQGHLFVCVKNDKGKDNSKNELYNLIRCSSCKGDLIKDKSVLKCKKCNSQYKIDSGVPKLFKAYK